MWQRVDLTSMSGNSGPNQGVWRERNWSLFSFSIHVKRICPEIRKNLNCIYCLKQKVFEHNDQIFMSVLLTWIVLKFRLFPASFFFIFVFSIQLMVNNICRWLNSNHGSPGSEATTLAIALQPFPQHMTWIVGKKCLRFSSRWHSQRRPQRGVMIELRPVAVFSAERHWTTWTSENDDFVS